MAGHSQSEWLLGTHTFTGSSTTLVGDIDTQDPKSECLANRPRGNRLRRWCYALHALFCILHLVLLGMLWHHPEHRFTLPFNNGILTSGLSAFLQAFYTLYTALLAFITQRLALSVTLSRFQKLTTAHDISAAWAGLGAAVLTLWKQTKIAVSTSATILVLSYLGCIFVLHVASPTIMQFQPYNASQQIAIPSNLTWPNPSVNVSALRWDEITPLVPPIFSFNSSLLSTSGLVNSTLYSTFASSPAIVNATVDASTIRAKCGLLPVLSSPSPSEIITINASLGGVDNATAGFFAPWKDEIFFLDVVQYHCATGTCLDYPLMFAASTAMKLDSSIQGPVSVNKTWHFTPAGEGAQNSSTTVYPIACSLYMVQHKAILDVQQDIMYSNMDPFNGSSQEWSMWSSQAASGNGMVSEVLDTGILSAMLAAYISVKFGANNLFCQQGLCPFLSTMDIYLMSLLGVNASANSLISQSESSVHPSVILSPAQMEDAISQMAAELIWLAGQLGESNGGYAFTSTSSNAIAIMLRWRLNIDKISVICALLASFLMLAIVHSVVSAPFKTLNSSVDSISVLEMLWIGAHSQTIQDRFHKAQPQEELRAIGVFDICLATDPRAANPKGLQDTSAVLELEDDMQVEQKIHSIKQPGSKTNTLCLVSILHILCYLLHSILVVLHIILVAVFIKKIEHHVVIPLHSIGITMTLKAALQLFYTLYTTSLVFMAQQLATYQTMTSKCDLTDVHDISCAWTGMGSAAMTLWRQKGSRSHWVPLWIVIYFGCISILHISSSTLMEFQAVNGTTTKTVESRLAWPDPATSLRDLNWTNISPLVTVADKLPDLSTNGLFSNVVYDIPTLTPNSTSLTATVGATTVNAHCGLLSNTSLFGPNNPVTVNLTIPSMGLVELRNRPMWNNTIRFIKPTWLSQPSHPLHNCPRCNDFLLFLVTTAVDLDSASPLHKSSLSVQFNWSSFDGWPPGSLMLTYFVGCSLDKVAALDILDLENDHLTGSHSTESDRSRQWTLWSPSNRTDSELGTGISAAMSSAPESDCPVHSRSPLNTQVCAMLTTPEVYIMEKLGINVTRSALTTLSGSAATSAITLGPSQFEKAVSEVAAQFIWLAGRVDKYGFEPTYGTSNVTSTVVQLQLNINIIPLSFALGASVILFLLLFCLIGVGPPRHVPISSLGVLETLLLESRSQRIHERMLEVEDPTMENLRRAGMLKVCVADELAVGKGGREDGLLTSLEDN